MNFKIYKSYDIPPNFLFILFLEKKNKEKKIQSFDVM